MVRHGSAKPVFGGSNPPGASKLVVEPRLAATGVFLAADNAQIDTFELGLLDEDYEGGPLVEEELPSEFRKDVRRWKVRHVFGAKVLDWRGMVRMVVTQGPMTAGASSPGGRGRAARPWTR